MADNARMRLAELSRRTGVAKPTIKYYIREGLLPPGRPAGRNQAYYDAQHEHRLRLIRALVEVGGLSIATTRTLLHDIDQAGGDDPHEVLGQVLYAAVDHVRPRASPSWTTAAAQVEELLSQRGWSCDNVPVRDALVAVVATFHDLHESDLLDALDAYADAAEEIAAADMATISRRDDLDAVLDGAVVGTIIGGALLLALRRVAHVDASTRRFRPPD